MKFYVGNFFAGKVDIPTFFIRKKFKASKVTSHQSKMAEGQDRKKITITIKTPKEKHTVEIEEDASIKDVSTDTHDRRLSFTDYFS